MRKKLVLVLPFLLLSCGGGGGNSSMNDVPQQVTQLRTVPVKVNLVFPEEIETTRGEDGTYKVVFLVNGLNISTTPQVFDNLFPGKHSFTVNVPVGGKRFMTVIISKFDNGGIEYPLYYGDTSFDMNENETTTLNIVMNLSFYKSGGNNYYPEVDKKKLFGDMSGETADIDVTGSYFADVDYLPSDEYSSNTKIPFKSYIAHKSFESVNGVPYDGWSSQTIYTYSNKPIPENIYDFYSFFYDSGIPSVFPSAPTPFNLGNGFSWNLIPEDGYFKVSGVDFDYDAGFQLEECEIPYSKGTWPELQNCQYQATKSFNVSAPGKPSGDIYLFYKTGTVNGSDVYLPYYFSLFAIPDTLQVSSNISYVLEHFHEVTYPQDRIEKDVGVKINIPSTPEGNVTVSPTYETYNVPAGQYYVEIFSDMEIPTPVDHYYLPGWEDKFFFGLNFSEMMDYQKLSSVKVFSPEGRTSSTTLFLPVVSGWNGKYALILTGGGNFHVVDVSDIDSVTLKDVSITGSGDTSGRYFFELTGSDAEDFTSCIISFNREFISDDSPADIRKLFKPDALLPLYIFKDLPPDRLFVKLPDTASPVDSIVVECSDGDGYKIRKYFHMGSPIQSAFDYPSTYVQSETLSFIDDSSGYITAHYVSAINSTERISIFSRIGDAYAEYTDYEIDTENNYITVYETIGEFLDQTGKAGETEGTFTFYITNYKGGTYRKGILSFQQAESEETVTLNPDGTADLTWSTDNFSQCSSNLKLLQDLAPVVTNNDGEEVVTTTADSTIYIYKLCPADDGGVVYYKRFDIAEPAQTGGTGGNGTLNTDTNIPDTSTPG